MLFQLELDRTRWSSAAKLCCLYFGLRTQTGALVDTELTRWIVISITTIVVVTIVGFTIVGGIAFSKVEKGAGKSFGLLFQRGNFLRVTTVVLVVIAAMFLAMAGKLNEGVVGLLSGVAGMALGGLDKTRTSDESGNRTES